jgi:plasmid stabilization system protein ParE
VEIAWTEIAVEQLEEARARLQKNAPLAGDGFVARVLEMVEELGRYPDLGKPVPEMEDASIQERLFGKHRIVYQTGESKIFVLGVLPRTGA